MNSKQIKNRKPKDEIIYVARNPITKKYERVYPEDELTGSYVIKMYWTPGGYVTIPED